MTDPMLLAWEGTSSIVFQVVSDKSWVLGGFKIIFYIYIFKGHFSYVNKEEPAFC